MEENRQAMEEHEGIRADVENLAPMQETQSAPTPQKKQKKRRELPFYEAPDPQPPRDKTSVQLIAALALLLGAYNALLNAIGLLTGQAFGGNLGHTALVAILVLIGVLEMISGVFALKSIKKPALRAKCKSLGMAMLIVGAAFMVSSFMIRGFEWSTIMNMLLGALYMYVLRI